MREIKFRAWDKERKMMSEYFGLQCLYAVFMEGDVPINHGRFDRLEVMQYTGLKDKNGKEIYEGDILNYPDKSPRYAQEGINHSCWWGVVEHYIEEDDSKSEFRCMNKGNKIIWKWSACEVIGNIWENPELLK